MMNLLVLGAVIALGFIIYSAWNSDTSDQQKKEELHKTGEKGCMWLFIFIGGIILVWILTSVFS